MLLFNNIENAVVWLYWFLNWSLHLLFYTFDSLSWQTLDDRRRYAKSVLMYKTLNDHIALVPRNSFVRRNVNQTNYHLRDTATDLTLSKPKREFLKRSFKFSVAMLWKQLLNKAKLAENSSISSLKKLIRSYLGLANLCILIVTNYLWLSV